MNDSLAATVATPRNRLRAAIGHRAEAPRHLARGHRLGPYVVERRLGGGGFGDVYEVVDEVLGRRGALKLLHAQHARSPELCARFEREARMLRELRHPSLVEVFDVGEADGRPFFVMELLEGIDASSHLRARGRCTPAEIVRLLGPICDALGALHAQHIVHRDLKPSNVFLASDGRVVLLDLGIAKPLRVPSLTHRGQVLGTPTYLTPEQLRGEAVDERSDVYQLGALAFELATGFPPFADASPALVQHRHLQAPREAPSRHVAGIPAAFDAAVITAMSVAPGERMPTAQAFHAALRAALPAEAPDGTRPSVALHLELVGPEPDDADPLFARWRELLAAHGFAIVLDSANAVLAARPLVEAERAALRPALVALGTELVAEAAARGSAVEVAVHVGEAEWRGAAAVGGALLMLDWVTGRAGLHVSSAV